MPSVFGFVLIALATYYISYVVTRSSGAFGIFRRWREYTQRTELFSCIQCLSIYVALGMVIVWTVAPIVVMVIAAAGAVIAFDNVAE